MKKEELNRLIDKYYNGESSESEEELLRSYFRAYTVSEEYSAESIIFGYYDQQAQIEEPSEGFESRVISGIDQKVRSKGSGSIRRILIPSMSAAAGIIIIIASYFFIMNRTQTFDTYSDPELAYAETVKILMEVSQKLNRGTMALEPVGKMNEVTIKGVKAINKSTSVMEENLKNIDYFKTGPVSSESSIENDK